MDEIDKKLKELIVLSNKKGIMGRGNSFKIGKEKYYISYDFQKVTKKKTCSKCGREELDDDKREQIENFIKEIEETQKGSDAARAQLKDVFNF